MIVDSGSDDVVYTSLFSGVHGSYLKDSVRNAGMDPDNLPEGDKAVMNFAAESKSKAWKDIWSAGQGVGAIDDVPTTRELVERMEREYNDTLRELAS